nr:Putative uncharacterized protein [Moritella viscosa]
MTVQVCHRAPNHKTVFIDGFLLSEIYKISLPCLALLLV